MLLAQKFEQMTADSPLHIGCPAWSVAAWKGEFLPAKAKPNEFLHYYSKVFNSVEGNTTFYALPKIETAKRWASSVEPGFQFCFKMPRVVSHESGLLSASQAVRDFRKFLEVFAKAKTLGPTFLQLHESFGASRLNELEEFLKAWPNEFPLAVEVRHREFFALGDPRKRFEELLSEQGVDRVIFDSRALFQSSPKDTGEQIAQQRKPNPPVHWTTTGKRPFVRLVSGSDISKSDLWLDELVMQTKQWIELGKHPYVFLHVPNDQYAPLLCERFYNKLRQEKPSLPELELSAAKGDQRELF